MPSPAPVPRTQEIPPMALGSHWLRLSPESRRLRFNGLVSDGAICERAATSAADLALALEIDGRHRAALEIFRSGAGHVEIAISVEDAYQGQGYGRRLLEAGLARAAEMGATSADLHFVRRNRGIIRLALGAGAKIEWMGNDGTAVISVKNRPSH